MSTPKLQKKHIHFNAILGNIGLLLHVPCLMALFSIIIAIIFNETYAILPYLLTGIGGIIIGQILYRLFYQPEVILLWDAMITAALGWLICSILALFPFIFVSINAHSTNSAIEAMQNPCNALFEAISGFTSTGLTMVQKPSELPRSLQWWRSLLEWVGGIGLVVFIVSLVKVTKEDFSLYYAESRREQFGKNIKQTTRDILVIYSIYTFFSCFLLYFSGMSVWDAVNHAMTGMATGGFSTSDHNLGGFVPSAQIAILFVMILGMLSLPLHYKMLRKGKINELWKNSESRLLFLLLFFGACFTFLLNLWTQKKLIVLDSVFQWFSALGTCGFSTITITGFAPIVRLFLIFAMFIGGSSDSTTGGIKICRFQSLVSSILIRIKSLTKQKQIHKEGNHLYPQPTPTDLVLPLSEKTKRLYGATILFILWNFVLFIGWFILLKWVPNEHAFNALFDATSALSNVGLSTGITTPALPIGGKIVLMCLMWLGRLEIIPVIIVFLSIILLFKKD